MGRCRQNCIMQLAAGFPGRAWRRTAVLLLLLLAAAVVHGLPPEPPEGAAVPTSGGYGGGVRAFAALSYTTRQPSIPELRHEAATIWRLSNATAQAINEPWGAGKIRICISPYTPGVKCNYTHPWAEEPSGYQVELFKALAANTSWLNTSATPWYFSCLKKTSAMLDGLVDPLPHGSCMIAPCNILASPQLVRRGIQLSPVVNKDGLLIMVRKTTDDGLLLWSPFMAFTWEVWLMLIFTGLAVGSIIVCCDIFAYRSLEESRSGLRKQLQMESAMMSESMRMSASFNRVFREELGSEELGSESEEESSDGDDGSPPAANGDKAARAGAGKDRAAADPPPEDESPWYERWFHLTDEEYKEWRTRLRVNTRRAVLRVVGMADSPIAKTLPAQMVLWGFGLLMMLIVALFTASSAAIFTKARMVTTIKSLEDLRGKAVGTWTPYTARLKDLGIAATPLNWEDEDDEAAMLNMLSSGALTAIVLDAAFVRYTVSRHCDLVAVGAPFALADYGYGYNKRLSSNLTHSMNRHIRAAIMDGWPEELFNKHVVGGDCPDEFKEAKYAAIRLRHVGGLWLALAICMLAGVLLLLLKYIQRRPMLKLKHVANKAALRRAQEARQRGAAEKAKQKFVLRGGLKSRKAPLGSGQNDSG